jgi:ketosteroid isomerase-like protein
MGGSVASPEELAIAFAGRFNARDMSALMELYEEDCVFTYDGIEKAVGKKQIEGALTGFMAAGLKFSGEYVNIFTAGDYALVRMRWELRESSGSLMAGGISAEVLKRGGDGGWRFFIDDAGGGMRGWQDVPTAQIQS